MNAVIFVTKETVEELTAFAEELAERQNEANTGKLLVVGSYYLDPTVLRTIAQTLSSSFEVTEMVTVQTSETQEAHTQIATQMATFLMQRYTTVPGPWLVIDGRVEISADNPITTLERAHNAANADNSGRAAASNGGRLAVGPMVLGANSKALRTLRTVSGEDWRMRGRFAFNVSSWCQIPEDQYPFRLPAVLEQEAISTGDEPPAPGEAQTIGLMDQTTPTPLRPAESPSSTSLAGMQPVQAEPAPADPGEMIEQVALTQAKKEIDSSAAAPLPASKSVAPSQDEIDPPEVAMSPADVLQEEAPASEIVENPGEPRKRAFGAADREKPFMQMGPAYYEKATREQLMDQVAHRSGKKPHPATKEAKLIDKLKAIDAAEAKALQQKTD